MIQIENLRKSFGDVLVFENISLKIDEGEFFSFLGPSGCGKTTLLRCLAGLEVPDQGEIIIGDRVVFSSKRTIFVPPEGRNLGMVFQSYAIWPNMRVFDNVAYGLKLMKVPKREIREKVEKILQFVKLEGLGARYATALSGGQQQRVALARSLVVEPTVILLDEPLSNLDAKLREEARLEIRQMQRQLGITAVYVTHDQTEAMVMSDKIAIMSEGRIEQIGTPPEVYENPRCKFVADFLGGVNFFNGKMKGGSKGREIIEVMEVGGEELMCARDTDLPKGSDILVCMRPNRIHIHTVAQGDRVNSFEGVLEIGAFCGDHWEYKVRVNNNSVLVRSIEKLVGGEIGSRVYISIDPEDVIVVAKTKED
jgi:iron(III) transport system ATP-binding protein